jgi:phage tail P2-like protein
MKLEDIQLEHLLPLFMRRDASAVAMAQTASEALQVVAREIRKLSTFDALDLLNTAELDALAEELNVLWYDKAFTDDQKRVLLLQSDQVYMRLGTVQAVQDVVTAIFGESKVEEFFTYGGNPHYFRIEVKAANKLSSENEAKLLHMLDNVKRKSQWLEKIYANTIGNLPLNVGFHVSYQRTETPRVDKWQDNAVPGMFNAGAAVETKHTDSARF